MPLTLPFFLLVSILALVVFLVVKKVRGIRWALLSGGLTFVGLSALFVAMLTLLTSQM